MRSMLRAILTALFVATASLGVSTAHAGEASDFTLRDIDGKAFSLAEQKGKVVILSFWATWCGPCKEEMPHLQKLYTEKKDDGLVVVSISADDARTASRVKPFIKAKGFDFPVLLDRESTVTGVYNPGKTLPYTVVIGRDFQVADAHAGYDPGDEVQLGELVDKLLGTPGE